MEDIRLRIDEIFEGGEPVYVFSHTVPPHPTWTFGATCEAFVTKAGPGLLLDYWGRS